MLLNRLLFACLLLGAAAGAVAQYPDRPIRFIVPQAVIVHVPYKGGAMAINDLIAGHVQLIWETLNVACMNVLIKQAFTR